MPLSASGRSSAYRPPPWNMRGRALALWFRLADPTEARRHVPQLLDMDPDPVLRARFWDLAHDALPAQTTSRGARDRVWTRFGEAVVAFPVRHAGIEADHVSYAYADDFAYIAFGREVMGWPVRDGLIEIDPEAPLGPAAGMSVRGRLERSGRTVMQATVTLSGTQLATDDSIVPRWMTTKVIPDVAGPHAALAQLVVTGPEVIRHRDVWQASGTLSFAESPTDELHLLTPSEVVAAEYWSGIDLTIGWGSVIEDLGERVWHGR